MRYPTSLAIYLDTGCNLQCSFCLYKGRAGAPGPFDIRNLDKIETAIKKAKSIVLSAWGEPLMSPHLPAVLEYIYARNSRPNLIAIVTNGTLLTPKIAQMLTGHLGDLVVSLNAGTAEAYRREMGGSLERTLEAVQSFTGALQPEDRGKIGLHMVVKADNFTEMAPIVLLAEVFDIKRVRVDHLMAASREEMGKSLLIVRAEYARAVETARAVANTGWVYFHAPDIENDYLKHCTSLRDECHVWADGRVSPCCYNGSTFLGNAYETDFETVWFGPVAAEARKRKLPQCESCPKILPLDDPRAHIYPLLYEELKREKGFPGRRA